MKPTILLPLFASALLAGCAAPADVATAPPAPPAAETRPAGGVVSAADRRAADAGARILREGGNAVDAGFATLLALNVVEPQSSGIGGGSFLVLDPGDGHPVTYDGRETAPASATPDRFMRGGKPMSFPDAWPGGLSTGVPGNVALMAMAHGKHGRLPWARLFQPAIELARGGFEVTPRLHNTLAAAKLTGPLSPDARAIFYPGGQPAPIGSTIRNPAFAALLERIAAQGPQAFYTGENAASIAQAVQTAPVNPGDMTIEDLGTYGALERGAVCGSYRVYRICGMGPPSSGATTVFAILKQLERFDMAAHGPDDPVGWHLFAESQRLAYADREQYLADPDYVQVPVQGLTDPDYLARRSALIDMGSTMASASAGTPAGVSLAHAPQPGQAEHGTSHFVVTDGDGMIVSQTSTIEAAFGSGLFVNGFYLNNELTDFSRVPMVDGQLVANRVEGGKRPRSSMSPTIVYGPDGTPRLAVGAAGGTTIIAQVAKAIIGVTDWGLAAQEAIALPFLYSPGDTLLIEEGTDLEAMLPAFRALGHGDATTMPGRLKANAVEWVDGQPVGAADPRSEGAMVTP
ncbi:gamma-glutamyltransferase family protein [Croceicoccus marinus]|uniref:Gamma-glutamyltransferase family protein n=1 Tax=Croceicoccus marinus TaxID=450378 RepID=A0A7G6VV64_9SPHN|nr:gamma-glutamyltransferase family protein [Croceicoccus marinus]QNE05629.1 gamma-glutamyltransferase family protein [Croceicoccus marinus]